MSKLKKNIKDFILLKFENYLINLTIDDIMYIREISIDIGNILFLNKIIISNNNKNLFFTSLVLNNYYLFLKINNVIKSKKTKLLIKKPRKNEKKNIIIFNNYLQTKIIKIIKLNLQFFNIYNKIELSLIIINKFKLINYFSKYFKFINYRSNINVLILLITHIKNYNNILKKYLNIFIIKKAKLNYIKKKKKFLINKETYTFLDNFKKKK